MPVAFAVCVIFFTNAPLAKAADEGGFLAALGKSDYQAAGLEKLSEAERARLDALVRAYAEGRYQGQAGQAVVAVAASTASPAYVGQPVAEPSVVPIAATPAPAEKSKVEKPKKVKIDPGTEIEYTTMDTELAGTFAGFERGTIFTLANGQRWKVIGGSYVCGPDPRVKKVRVKPGVLGAFFLEFENVRVRAKVQLLK